MSKVDRKSENVAAALDALDATGANIVKSVGTIKRRIEDLEDQVETLKQELRAQELEFNKTETGLKTRLDIAEDKLRKVQVTLS